MTNTGTGTGTGTGTIQNINKDCLKRIAKDYKDILKSPLTNNGIYYKHDESNVLVGYAMIIGPENTPYHGGYYLFQFQFPTNYPYSPPVIKFKTNDGIVRFHPNLYTNEFVCLSILNTWPGEPWSPCQSISSILLTMCTLFTNNSLMHEPGINSNNYNIYLYNKIIEFANIRVAMQTIITRDNGPFECFKEDMIKSFLQTYDSVTEFIDTKIADKTQCSAIYKVPIYDMCIIVDYIKLKPTITQTKTKLLKS